jgi:uncharacterized protein (DUF1330 family)
VQLKYLNVPAYVIGRLQIHDPSWVADYVAKNEVILRKHGGRYVVRTGHIEPLEGDMPLPGAMVVLEFPSQEHARAWYSDPEYAPLIERRQRGATGDAVIVEGV